MSSTEAVSLSVIIPTYNRSAHVRDCLVSLRESGVPDLEIIVSDDGSSDDTAAVVAATAPQARYVWQPNSGTPATARNRGFALSRGRYVAFLDCDDRWLPDTPANIVALLDRHADVDAIFADARIVGMAGSPTSWLEYAPGPGLFALPQRQPEPGFHVFERRPFFHRTIERNPVFISALIMRREAFERAGGFDPELRGAADWELWMRMAAQTTFACWTQPLAIYLRHDDCMSYDAEHMGKEFWLALKKCLEKCPELTADERELLRGRLRQAHFVYGYHAYDRGHYREARGRFASMMGDCGFEARIALLWLLCALPFGLGRGLRKIKQALGC